MGYQWKEITQNFNRSLPFTKVRWDLSQDAGWATTGGNTANGAFSETPGVNIDGLGWKTVSGATYGYAGQNRFSLRAPIGTTNGYVFSCRESFTDRSIKQYATQISTNVYEYTYPKTLYWAGIGISTLPYSTEGGTGVYVYVQASTFEITPTETATTYESGTTTVTVNTDNDSSITWTASTTDSWLSLSPSTGAGDGSVTITYAENLNYSPRTGIVTFTSSEGETLTFTLEQEKKPVLVYDRPIYRSGSLVKKMYRSGNLIYARLNPPSEEPEPPTPPEPTYQWVEVTADFDRSLPFTKVRWDFSKSWNDGFFSELPNINCDNKGWTSITGAEWGYAGQYTMNLSAKKCYIRNQSTGSYSLYDMYNITTQVDTNIYEYEYSVPLYWGGVSNSSLYNNGLGLYVYVEVNPTNE